MPQNLDERAWCSTDRPGERLWAARPLRGVEVLAVRGSHRHWCESHDTFTVALVHREQGEVVAEWRTRGRTLSTGRGELMLIEPGDVHVTRRVQARTGAADFDVLRFSPELLTAAAKQAAGGSTFHFRAPATQDPDAFAALRRFMNAVAAGEDGLSLEAAATEAISALLGLGERAPSYRAPLAPERDFRLRRVSAYLASHLERRPTLAELEGVSGISQWRLCALFRRSQGISIGRYWNALRLRRAQRDIERGSSLAMVAAELGFRDEAYLCRVFKAHWGVTPGTWRALARRSAGPSRRASLAVPGRLTLHERPVI